MKKAILIPAALIMCLLSSCMVQTIGEFYTMEKTKIYQDEDLYLIQKGHTEKTSINRANALNYTIREILDEYPEGVTVRNILIKRVSTDVHVTADVYGLKEK